MGQEKNNQYAHISTVNIAVLPSLSDTVPLFFSPVYSESSTHPSSESTTLCSPSSIKSIYIYPMLQNTNTSLTSHCIFANSNTKTMQQEVIEFSPFIGRKFLLKPVSVWLCFPRQRQWSSQNEALILRAAWAQPQGTRASFCGTKCVKSETFQILYDYNLA